MRERVIQEILDKKIIAIVRGVDEEQALEVAKALYEGGITLVELSFNQNEPETFATTAKAIRNISKQMDGKVFVGAGTVVTMDQLYMAMNNFAQFIISPDTDTQIINKTRQMGLVSLPGAYTSTEVKQAHAAGADFVKLFPCIGDTPAYLKTISTPLNHVRFLAFGGVNADNAKDLLKAGAVGLGVGSCLVNKQWVDDGEYWRITEAAKKLIASIG